MIDCIAGYRSRGNAIMHRQLSVLFVGLVLSTSAVAQDVARTAVRQAMVDVANGLLATVAQSPTGVETMLGINQKASLQLPIQDPERENWQYWPTVRVGLPLENMNAVQRRMVHDLLTSALSSNGSLKVANIMQLEEILDVLDEAGLPRSVDHYRLTVFGTPTIDGAWAWRFEGHHVSLSVAVSPDGIAVTPSFFGSNPAEVVGGPLAGFRVHGIVEDLARELLMSMSAPQRSRAIVAERAPAEIFTGNINKERTQWEAWRTTLRPEGVPVAELNEVQQHWVRRILDEVVGNYRPEISNEYLRNIAPRELSFAWMGGVERHMPHYFRLQGPDFLFEYDNVQNSGNHVHSVWRSKAGDFGVGILERHYQTSHLR
jgi:hypothetical protein